MDQPSPATPARRRSRRAAAEEVSPTLPGLQPPPAATPAADSPAVAAPAATVASLLERLDRCAAECEQVERVLGGRGVPELETIIKLHRLLILRLSLEAEAAPELFKLIEALMKPVMDWARLEEKRQEREQAELQRRNEQAASGADALQPATLEKIQQELSLL